MLPFSNLLIILHRVCSSGDLVEQLVSIFCFFLEPLWPSSPGPWRLNWNWPEYQWVSSAWSQSSLLRSWNAVSGCTCRSASSWTWYLPIESEDALESVLSWQQMCSNSLTLQWTFQPEEIQSCAQLHIHHNVNYFMSTRLAIWLWNCITIQAPPNASFRKK